MPEERERNRDRWERPKAACSSLILCTICRQIFSLHEISPYISTGKIWLHQSSGADLLAAAEQRCYICRSIRDRLIEVEVQIASPVHVEPGNSLRFWYRLDGHPKDAHIIFSYGYQNESSIEILDLVVRTSAGCNGLAREFSGSSTWSTANKERAKQWLAGHLSHLDFKFKKPDIILPKRILHVQALDNDLYQVTLCDRTTLPQGFRYLTLSHCWGQTRFFRLVQDNIEDLKRTIPYQSLPKTFREAIKVTCDLDFQYLWIDSLCIIQDSPEDWLSQGSIMGDIYMNAACNISADSANNGEAGLFRTRDVETFLPLRVDVAWQDPMEDRHSLECYVFEDDSWKSTIGGAPLASRAWVFQERLLSFNAIHFTTRQLFFETKNTGQSSDNCNEQWPDGLYPGYLTFPKPDEIVRWWQFLQQLIINDSSWQFWFELVEKYSHMKLTYDIDRLAALSGVAKSIETEEGGRYLAGLWAKGLPYQLLWHSIRSCSSQRPQPYIAPTWSWASTGSVISHGFKPKSVITRIPNFGYCFNGLRYHEHIKVVEARTLPMLERHDTGPIKNGFLRVRGSLRQARLTENNPETKAKAFWTVGSSRKKITFIPDEPSPGDVDDPLDRRRIAYLDQVFNAWRSKHSENPHVFRSTVAVHAPTQSVYLLPIISASRRGAFVIVGLTLIPTDLEPGRFRRVGLFFTSNGSGVGSILHLPYDIEESYYEKKKKRGRYTISII